MKDLKSIRNEVLFEIFYVLSSSLPIFIVNILYYKSKGLNFKEIMLLQAISSFVVVMLEVPSGILADLYSRKKIMIVGLLCSLFDLLFILFFQTFPYFVVASILGGISEAFLSGSDTAMIYDHFKQNGKEEAFEDYFASISSKNFIMFSISTLLGGSLFAYRPDLVVWISILFQGVALCCVILFQEKFERDSSKCVNIKDTVIQHFKILKRKELLSIVMLFLIMTVTIATLNQLTQEYLVEIHFDLKYLGILFFAFNMISALGSKYHMVTKRIGVNGVLLLFASILVTLSFVYHIGAIAVLILARFFSSGVWPSLTFEFNKLIESEDRASIISYKNLLISIAFVIVDPLTGVLIDLKSVHYVYFVFGMVLLVYFVKRLITCKQ